MASPLEELKHSVKIHLLIMNGPSQQLCAFLIKIIDFLEDEDNVRRDSELAALACNIIEGLALYLQRYIDKDSAKMPDYVKMASNNLLIKVGESRGLENKITAKYVIMSAICNALKRLAEHTKSNYPKIHTADGAEL